MSYIVSNLGPILAATLTGLVIGLVYRAILLSPAPGGRATHPAVLFVIAALAEFWLAAILAGALILAPVQASPWTIAIGTTVIIWIGFIVPVLAVSYPARHLGLAAPLLDAIHWLAVMVAQAAVLNAVGLVKP